VSWDQATDNPPRRTVTAVLHHLVPHATIIGIDHLQGLVDLAKENLSKDGVKLGTAEGGVEIICGDGRLGERWLGVHQQFLLTARSPYSVQDRLNMASHALRMP